MSVDRSPKYWHSMRYCARKFVQASMEERLPTNLPVAFVSGDAAPVLLGEKSSFRSPPPEEKNRNNRYIPATRHILCGEDWIPPSGKIELRGPGRPRKN